MSFSHNGFVERRRIDTRVVRCYIYTVMRVTLEASVSVGLPLKSSVVCVMNSQELGQYLTRGQSLDSPLIGGKRGRSSSVTFVGVLTAEVKNRAKTAEPDKNLRLNQSNVITLVNTSDECEAVHGVSVCTGHAVFGLSKEQKLEDVPLVWNVLKTSGGGGVNPYVGEDNTTSGAAHASHTGISRGDMDVFIAPRVTGDDEDDEDVL
ncbi:hypothetical protein EYF80_043015 [Liparis tanakae]|uniref:Uncharacterized protein n=1 Tax=Liparis tanakae TaxID=230148 RepID=A0A4Z2G1T1_9TELE|nr:hypothetical protein EYF80_043015 [Liparis tanakae]